MTLSLQFWISRGEKISECLVDVAKYDRESFVSKSFAVSVEKIFKFIPSFNWDSSCQCIIYCYIISAIFDILCRKKLRIFFGHDNIRS